MPVQNINIESLVAAATSVYGEFSLDEDFSAGSCAAAIQTVSGAIFTGICVDVACGIGFCAEHAAIAEMLKTRETRISAVVAVAGDAIVPPCGRCREFIAQISRENLDTKIVLGADHVLPLRDLLPSYWRTTS